MDNGKVNTEKNVQKNTDKKTSKEPEIKSRMYELERKEFKTNLQETKIKYVYQLPNSGDYISEWIFSIPATGGRRKNELKFIVDDIVVSGVAEVEKRKIRNGSLMLANINQYKLSVEKLRNTIKEIDDPVSKKDNKLVNIGRIFSKQVIESLKSYTKDTDKKLPRYSDEILNNTVWMGGICIEITSGQYPPPKMLVQEKYYEFLSPIIMEMKKATNSDKEMKVEMKDLKMSNREVKKLEEESQENKEIENRNKEMGAFSKFMSFFKS